MKLIKADDVKEMLESYRYHSFNLDDALHVIEEAPEVKAYTKRDMIEAIEVLNNWDMACPICEKRKSEEKGVCADCRFNKALNFAIKALEERPQGEFSRKDLESWLYQIAMNNIGTDFEKSVVEIIHRLDGFERFVSEQKGGAE